MGVRSEKRVLILPEDVMWPHGRGVRPDAARAVPSWASPQGPDAVDRIRRPDGCVSKSKASDRGSRVRSFRSGVSRRAIRHAGSADASAGAIEGARGRPRGARRRVARGAVAQDRARAVGSRCHRGRAGAPADVGQCLPRTAPGSRASVGTCRSMLSGRAPRHHFWPRVSRTSRPRAEPR